MLDLINPVIAAVRTDGEFAEAVKANVSAVFMLKADVLTLPALARGKGVKKIYVHIDTAEGIGKDKKGLEYLKNCGADGIISTKNHMIALAKELGLGTVQRFFPLSIRRRWRPRSKSWTPRAPIMPNLCPAYLPKAVKSFVEKTRTKIIAGGLIETKKDVFAALSAGADGVSTGKKELWNI